MDKSILATIAREAIEEAVTGTKQMDRAAWVAAYPWLAENGAVFVTLNKHHRLRGCIGSIIAHEPLIDDLIRNARSAALHDPRFPPLRRDDLAEIEVEVSLLTPPEPVVYRDVAMLRTIIRPGVDGIILQLDGHQATYLPSVWEQLDDFDLFFASLCQKAGLPESCLESHPAIYRYQAEKWV